MVWWITSLILLATGMSVLQPAYSCNEAVCASVVSKCMLTQSCKCDIKTCSCCKECYNCLGTFYSECCSCVEICPKPNDTSTSLGKLSHVEDFPESYPELFNSLTEAPDVLERWVSYTFPIDQDSTFFRPKLEKEIKYRTQSAEQEVAPMKNVITVNCTVAYMSQCTSWPKCKDSCLSTGASSYRWFHDGCCECVGPTCINYGINESRCLECPMHNEEIDSEEDESSLVYDDYTDYRGEDKSSQLV